MKIFTTKPDWMTDSAWRALRTFWQTFWASFSVTLVAVLIAYGNGGEFNWNTLWLQGAVMAIATAIAKVMNKSTDTDTTE